MIDKRGRTSATGRLPLVRLAVLVNVADLIDCHYGRLFDDIGIQREMDRHAEVPEIASALKKRKGALAVVGIDDWIRRAFPESVDASYILASKDVGKRRTREPAFRRDLLDHRFHRCWRQFHTHQPHSPDITAIAPRTAIVPDTRWILVIDGT